MLYNIHTHNSFTDRDAIFQIRNIHDDFGQSIAGQSVSMGLHPWYLSHALLQEQFLNLHKNAQQPAVFAIGECGLDKISNTDWDLQLKAFRMQIGLAQDLKKPLIIHCVRAFDAVLQELHGVNSKIIFHGINNKYTVVARVIDDGHYLSFGKSLLSSNSSLLDTFRKTPLEQVFLETDDLVNDISEIYKLAAAIKEISEDELISQLEKNFINVFGS